MQHPKKDIDIASDSGGWHISSDDHVNIRLNKATEIDARKHRETWKMALHAAENIQIPDGMIQEPF